MFSAGPASRYSLLSNPSYTDDEEHAQEKPEDVNKPPSQSRKWAWTILIVLLFVLTALVSSFVGYRAGLSIERSNSLYNIDKWSFRTSTQSFQYNRTFSEAPSPETDAAWMSIFPPHGGFFHDKSVSEHGASLAVYHQLHCLDAIRHAYWILHDAVANNKTISLDGLQDWYTPWHTRHCIDFLRQMLMCNADVTVEKNDPDIGGIRGFGIDHTCKKWDDVVQWTLDRQKAGEDQGYVYPSDIDFR